MKNVLHQIFLKSNEECVDPLSPYLFIIALEVLNIAIRESKEIVGIKMGNEEIKLNVFADYLATSVKNTKSFFSLKQVINNFGYVSGLQLNEEKTEAYWLAAYTITLKILE